VAQFIDAFNRTTIKEGGYSDHPNDPGGETYVGISRKYFPQWGGWSMIDAVDPRPKSGDPTIAFANADNAARLGELVEEFYKKNFWDRIHGDAFDSQAIASKLFDQIVNLGPRKPVGYFQMALNGLNSEGELWPDIAEDGSCGARTIAAANFCEQLQRTKYLLGAMIGFQVVHYHQLFRANPRLEKFAAGWMRRAFSGLDDLVKMGFD
jgi:lysozyme family protein